MTIVLGIPRTTITPTPVFRLRPESEQRTAGIPFFNTSQNTQTYIKTTKRAIPTLKTLDTYRCNRSDPQHPESAQCFSLNQKIPRPPKRKPLDKPCLHLRVVSKHFLTALPPISASNRRVRTTTFAFYALEFRSVPANAAIILDVLYKFLRMAASPKIECI